MQLSLDEVTAERNRLREQAAGFEFALKSTDHAVKDQIQQFTTLMIEERKRSQDLQR